MSNIITLFRENYIFKLLSLPALDGLKVILLDQETSTMVGLAVSYTEMVRRDVMLHGLLVKGEGRQSTGTTLNEGVDSTGRANREDTAHLKAIVILRPSQSSVDALIQQLSNPQFNTYYIFFTNSPTDEQLRSIARADSKYQSIRHLSTYFADYYALEPSLFVANTWSHSLLHLQPTTPINMWNIGDKRSYTRSQDMLLAILLTIKTSPSIYSVNSPSARLFASDISKIINNNPQRYTFPNQNGTSSIFILDRRDDPITPITLSWSYLPMINEFLSLKDNRIDLTSIPGFMANNKNNTDNKASEFTLSTVQDEFYSQHIYSGFGDIHEATQRLIEQFKKQRSQVTDMAAGKENASLDQVLNDLRQAADKIPEIQHLAHVADKHLTLLSEISKYANKNKLFAISELQQNVICENAHKMHVADITKILYDTTIHFDHKLSLVLLYAIKYENEPNNETQHFKSLLRSLPLTDEQDHMISSIDIILSVCGSKSRSMLSSTIGEVSHNRSIMNKFTDKLSATFKGNENILTRHKPLILNVLETLSRQQLKTSSLISHRTGINTPTVGTYIHKPNILILFVLGGITFSEAAVVHQFNTSQNDIKVLIGSSRTLNCKQFVSDLAGPMVSRHNDDTILDFL